eukprot:TRINITY_DN6561_c0_g2_i1.p1 TRINITY_DN6561_c0_g2~~TRINITY_DN6561_c0_g2_i1.p1  ORF type:complete len:458 (-),score=116.76 TRINITY_DN6561_c0_g2_i1:898-2271(-)
MSVSKTVLVLGAGLVTGPLVNYLSGHGYKVLVATRTIEKAIRMAKGKANVEPTTLDIENPNGPEELEQLMPQADAVVSMLPATHHPTVAKSAIRHKKHFFSSSYIADSMLALDEAAKSAGVILLNECGVDPGTDHMSAMRVIDGVRSKGGWINSFTSICGGLPAPEDNNNPFGYKFSWAPRGVLLASRNDATFLRDGKKEYCKPGSVFEHGWREKFDEAKTGLELEVYPNRDSIKYIDVYGTKRIRTIIRGTYRYVGWCETLTNFDKLGMLDMNEGPLGGKTYAEFMRERVARDPSRAPSADLPIKDQVAKYLGLDGNDQVMKRFEWLGLFSSEKKIPEKIKTPLDTLCDIMLRTPEMSYAEGERDMIAMRHKYEAEFPDGKKSNITTTLVAFGIKNGDSAMARTVSLPVAICVRLVLEGAIKRTGVCRPTVPDIYNPILNELEKDFGIRFADVYDD